MMMAEKFGYINVDEMLASVTSKQLTEWRAFYTVRQEMEKEQEAAARGKRAARGRHF